MMNFNIFNIVDTLNSIRKDSMREYHFPKQEPHMGVDSFKWGDNIDKTVESFLSKRPHCYQLLETQRIKNTQKPKIQYEIINAAFIIELSSEIEKVMEAFTPQIIGPTENVDMGGFFIFNEHNKFKAEMFDQLHKILIHFLKVGKEIYDLIMAQDYYGAIARYRMLIEVYSIFSFFTNHPACLERFRDQSIAKQHFFNKRNKAPINEELESKFQELKERYTANEINNMNLNYWWAGEYILNHKSIKEIMEIALHSKEELDFFLKDYNFYSEYSHVSSYVVNSPTNFNLDYFRDLTMRLIDMHFCILQLYVGWLLDKSFMQNSPLQDIISILKKLREKIVGYKEPEMTIQEMIEQQFGKHDDRPEYSKAAMKAKEKDTDE
ncbi:MAG: DUF5677 domain-containing protein [Spirochaetaceae bacterium]|jgi:hypothetical protein|nr:DUF5677 domain-containing protein [Spirochaetaceae bacterium]